MRRSYQLTLPILTSLLALALLLTLAGSVRAANITVTTTNDTVLADGQCSLREAVQAANTNVTVNECAAGSIGLDTIIFNLPADSIIVLTGGELSVIQTVIIDGSGAPNLTISGNSTSRIFKFSAAAPATISNLTVAYGNTPNSDGGAIYSSASLTLTNVNILSSTAESSGGGGFVSGTTILSGSLLRNNRTTSGPGGGLFSQATLIVTNTQFISNFAKTLGGGARASTATLTGGLFENNRSDRLSSGGGLFVENTVTLTNTQFISNISSSGSGGGLRARTAMLNSSRFENNQALLSGGGLSADSANVVNTQFINNRASNHGGGLHASVSVTCIDSFFEGNRTNNNGGGLYSAGPLNLTNTQFISNRALLGGGGAYASEATVNSNHFENNQGRTGGGLHTTGFLTLTDTWFISNTASPLDGGGLYAEGAATINNGRFANNQAANGGGGLYAAGPLTLINSDILSNSSQGLSGGGVYVNTLGGNISSSRFENNQAPGTYGYGGGLYSAGYLILTNTQFISNMANNNGGGIYAYKELFSTNSHFKYNKTNNQGGGLYAARELTLVAPQFTGNTAQDDGGGLFALNNTSITKGYFEENWAGDRGGGLFSYGLSLATTQLISNIAQNEGGGGYFYGGTLGQVTFSRNSAGKGGGLYLLGGNLSQSNGVVTFTHNIADTGGGLYINGYLTLNNARILSNTASTGGALYNIGAMTTVINSCIVFNSDTAISSLNPVDATSNWWGIPNGPAGAGPGSGDSISTMVDFSGFLTAPPPFCPAKPFVDLQLSKRVRPLAARPGESITYTLTFSNVGNTIATGVVLTDLLPISLTNISLSSNMLLTDTGAIPVYRWQVQDIAPNQRGIITLTGWISANLGGGVFTNTATISTIYDHLPSNNNAAVGVHVISDSENAIYIPLIVKNVSR